MNHIPVSKRERAYHEMKKAAVALETAKYHLNMAAECVEGTETSTALKLVAEATSETRALIDVNEAA